MSKYYATYKITIFLSLCSAIDKTRIYNSFFTLTSSRADCVALTSATSVVLVGRISVSSFTILVALLVQFTAVSSFLSITEISSLRRNKFLKLFHFDVKSEMKEIISVKS